MYDELVKRLKEDKSWVEQGTTQTEHEIAEHIQQAADAIEELTGFVQEAERDRDEYRERLDKANDAIDKLSKPKWIPVTERLPNGEADRYLVAASLMSLGLWVSICYYADNLEEVDEYDFKGENHGGFYGYDDEYGYYEKSDVKYWIPLPTPPKEET